MSETLTLRDLMGMCCFGCGRPAEDHILVLKSTCHPRAGVDVKFQASNGTLLVECHACERLVTVVKVATE